MLLNNETKDLICIDSTASKGMEFDQGFCFALLLSFISISFTGLYSISDNSLPKLNKRQL